MTATIEPLIKKFDKMEIMNITERYFMDATSKVNNPEISGTDEYIQYLRDCNVPTNERYLPRVHGGCYGLYNDKIPTTYEYYRKFINDVLHTIRGGKSDYCYELYQIKELLRFEPDMQIKYRDGAFVVSLPHKNENNGK